MEPKTIPKIFINYRRDDEVYAKLLDKTLGDHFGDDNVFRDLSDLRSGTVYDEAIAREINTCDFMLVVIGKHWLEITQERDNQKKYDYARKEIATALQREPQPIVIPVVLEDVAVPSSAELPEDVNKLVGHQESRLSVRWWDAATGKLIKEIEEEFANRNPAAAAFHAKRPGPKVVFPAVEPVSPKPGLRNSRLSFYCGLAASVLSGAVIGVVYTASAPADVELSRPLIVAAYALLVGASVSGTINFGIKKASSLGNNSSWAKLIGSILGGVVGGIFAAVLAVVVFGNTSGPVVNPKWLTVAAVSSNFAVTIGILAPELRQRGEKRLFAIVVLILVSLLIWFVADRFVDENKAFLEAVFGSRSALSREVWLSGAVVGALLGAQVGTTVFFSQRSSQET